MNLEDRANRLARRLGVQVVRTEELERLRRRAARRGRRARAGRSAPRPPAPRPAEPVRQPSLPSDYEPEFVGIWEQVKDRTMTSHHKGYFLHHAVRYVERHQVPGAIVECGVWRGGSMLNVALTLLQLSSTSRDLYLFDTFTGMTAPSDRDVRRATNTDAGTLMEQSDRTSKLWAVADLDDVRSGFAAVAYPQDRVHFVQGRVEDTVPERAPEEIAILRLDTDWYESTRHELEHLYPRLASGGVLIIDDYGSWKGAKDATDEFLEATGERLLFARAGHGRVAVKPGLPSRVPAGQSV